MTKPLASRIAFVTGASRGIGYATARALAKTAPMSSRWRERRAASKSSTTNPQDGGSATWCRSTSLISTASPASALALHERHGKIDILVGNAGVAGPSSPLGHIEVKPWTDVMAVDVTANFQLVRCMEPLLKQSDAGRAVFVTSGAANKAPAYLGPYAASKAALRSAGAGLGGGKPRARSCASTCSTPARSAPACAPRCSPAKIRQRWTRRNRPPSSSCRCARRHGTRPGSSMISRRGR